MPGVGVDINLSEVRGGISDAQYGLLLSVFGQNFSERSSPGMPQGGLEQSTLALPHSSYGKSMMGDLAKILECAKKGSVDFGLNAVYNIEVGLVELLLGVADDVDTGQSCPLMRATGKALRVHYEMLDSHEARCDIENIDGLEERLAFGCRWSFESLEVLDRSSQQQRAKPFLTVTPTIARNGRNEGEKSGGGPCPPL